MASKVRKPKTVSKRSGRDAGSKADKKTKKQVCMDLLKRAGGASLEDLRKATGWQAHSVRGFLAGTVRKQRGFELTSEALPGKTRRYRVIAQHDAA